ncbi:ubiquitin carboxyl-terminal hydrolase 9-like [Magnolia sinica]|uniref:ubiquitin carboxyl-terminal hydrolase 9-like n=1 Tax=Magnolia sinica TaxID=86752 RepID=UPI00265A65A3|nr:ubiquitin carboxyl-terminal hydrolase 9-like [Magnolia sinica]
MTIPGSGFLMENEESCLPCTPEEERRIIKELTEAAESNLKEGSLYFVVSNRWWRDWQEYVRQDENGCSIDEHCSSSHHMNGSLSNRHRPGQIDNSDLVLNGMEGDGNELELRRLLEEGHDYVLVPQEVWKKLLEWYTGGPAIPRKLISQGVFRKGFIVEVYPLSLQLIDARDNTQSVIRISKRASVRELYNRVCTLLKLEQEKVRIWDYFNKKKQELLTDFNRTLEDAQLQMDQHILLEVEVDGFWPSGSGLDSTGNGLALVPIEPSRSSTTIAGGPTMSNGYSTGYGSNLYGGILNSTQRDTEDGRELLSTSTSTKGDGGGLNGLQNLGNTCFMNSALQCLVHTPPLVEYFIQDYSEEINRWNPLGLKGELAIAFGELLRKLWSPGRIPIAPRAFKGKLARFAPQFSGFNQHDSQELLAFLLDGLHEDLNRVKDKPYFETKDANGRPDEEFADECWRNHKARNDSIIVDVCQGQYKSTLVCPNCSKVSVTFDPFMYLSLPLPSMAKRTMTVTVFYGDGSALPMPFTVSVPKHGCCKDLSQVLSSECCLRIDESILLAEVYGHRIYRYLDNPSEPLAGIKDDDHIVAYRLPIKREKLPRLEVLHMRRERSTSDLQNGGYRELLGTPLVSYLGEDVQTGGDIQAAVRSVLAPLLRRKEFLPPNHVKTGKENGSSVVVDADSPMENYEPCSSPKDCSIFDMELEQSPSEDLGFHLWLTDEKGLSRIPIENDSPIRPDAVIKVLLDWSEREFELYDFSFLEDLPEVLKSGFTMKKTRQEAISLFSCLESFLKEEPLGPDDMWYCPTCKEHRQATKKLDLWRLPEILVVHLKRFSYSRYLKNKLDTFVNFPINNLDLSKYVKHKGGAPQSHVYELYAVSNHYGGLGGGHYSAYVKLVNENRWYDFDDSHVSPVGEEAIKTSAAYVLFYRRVKVEPGAGQPSGASSPSR